MSIKAATTPPKLVISSIEDADRLMAGIQSAAARVHEWIADAAKIGDPMAMLKHMKFDQVGFHPIAHHDLNLVEQINQTWTFVVAIAAARQLLLLHPEAGGFHLAPGANSRQSHYDGKPLDIMSGVKNLVGAETFAAVDPNNNGKIEKDVAKLVGRPETYRYVFFMSPAYAGNARLKQFERDGVQVWSVDV